MSTLPAATSCHRRSRAAIRHVGHRQRRSSAAASRPGYARRSQRPARRSSVPPALTAVVDQFFERCAPARPPAPPARSGTAHSGVIGWKSLTGSKRTSVYPRHDCEQAVVGEKQRVAVGRDLLHRRCRRHAAAAAAVVDHDRWSSGFRRPSARPARVTTSELPPGGNGTMMVMGREG